MPCPLCNHYPLQPDVSDPSLWRCIACGWVGRPPDVQLEPDLDPWRDPEMLRRYHEARVITLKEWLK